MAVGINTGVAGKAVGVGLGVAVRAGVGAGIGVAVAFGVGAASSVGIEPAVGAVSRIGVAVITGLVTRVGVGAGVANGSGPTQDTSTHVPNKAMRGKRNNLPT